MPIYSQRDRLSWMAKMARSRHSEKGLMVPYSVCPRHIFLVRLHSCSGDTKMLLLWQC